MIRQRRSMMLELAVATVAAVIVVAAAPAWATDPASTHNRVAVRAGAPVAQSGNPDLAGHHHHRVPRIVAPGSEHNFGPSYPFGRDYAGPSYPFGRTYTGPSYPSRQQYSAPARQTPVVVTSPPSTPRWVPAHWAQQWVPQYYTYDAWVPGYFGRNGWVEGRYERQVAESGGHYDRIWVEGYWAE